MFSIYSPGFSAHGHKIKMVFPQTTAQKSRGRIMVLTTREESAELPISAICDDGVANFAEEIQAANESGKPVRV